MAVENYADYELVVKVVLSFSNDWNIKMTSESRIDAAHQALGEFVIIFQSIENTYRQIGWFILDPDRADWPPMQLRKESNCELINTVSDLFVDLVKAHDFPNGAIMAEHILSLKSHFHALRRYRNRLLHSTFVELKGGGDVLEYLRCNPDITVDPDTGELVYDHEDFSADVINAKIKEYAHHVFRLGQVYVQLVHWSPFGRFERVP